MTGRFKVSVPMSTAQELIEDGCTLALHVRPECEPLYLKRYELPSEYSLVSSVLEAEARRFLKQGIIPVCGKILGSSIEGGEVNGATYAQLVAKISDSHWWIARLIAKPEAKFYFLLHGHGDRDYLMLATAIFSEFYILE